jgi:uncharacterized protein YijF (DUF1287 family)
LTILHKSRPCGLHAKLAKEVIMFEQSHWQSSNAGRWIVLLLCMFGCMPLHAEPSTSTVAASPHWIAAARKQVGITLHYDPSYVRLSYPGGDVPPERGVCTDVLIRAMREVGLDLQRAVHEDMREAFASYPKRWGLSRPDRNIDHRRVPNLETWMQRQGWKVSDSSDQPLPGDVITWELPGNLPHIGIVSDQYSADGARLLILHNVGAGTREEDVLERWPRVAHFRPKLQL